MKTEKIDINQMTVRELEDYQQAEFARAERDNLLAPLYSIAEILGASVSATYTKYHWESDDRTIRIFFDAYGGYLTLHYKQIKVVSTHLTERLFVDGAWREKLNVYAQKAAQTKEQQDRRHDEQRRLKLMARWQCPA